MSEFQEIMPLPTFSAYRKLAREKKYCEPWVPYVGPDFGTAGRPRIVYCGAAPFYDRADSGSYPEDDEVALRLATERWADFAGGGGYKSGFWRLGKLLAESLTGPAQSATPFSKIAWTNLTKVNEVGRSTPRRGGSALRSLDVAQMQREIELFRPDLLVCVSGSMMVPTGNAAFSHCDPLPVQSQTPDTIVKRLPTGGVLYWTQHPGPKGTAWMQSVISDLKGLIGSGGR